MNNDGIHDVFLIQILNNNIKTQKVPLLANLKTQVMLKKIE